MLHVTTRASLSAVLALVAAGVLAAQQPAAPPPTPDEPPPLTFRVEVNYVEVDVLVTDEQGNPVTDLTIDDFEVLEDGEAQELAAFSHVNIPVTRAERPLFSGTAIEPDVQRNDAVDGRLYLIVLDELHTSFSSTPRVRAAVRQFIERDLGANDLAAVVFAGGRTREAQDFTSNPRLLLAAVDRFTGRALPALGSSDPFSAPCGFAPGFGDPCDAERGMHARTTLSTIRQLAEFLSGVRGRRKAMLFVSEGIGYDVYDVFSNRSASSIIDETREAIAAATRSNVSIYALDARGLATFDDGIFSASNSSETEAALTGGDPQAGTPSPSSRLRSHVRLAQDSLRALAEETGGFAAVNRNDFESVFDRIVRDNSNYYVMGYYPSNLRRDGRFRRIDVRVRRPGVTVRARRGYVAPRGRAPEARAATPGENPVSVAAREMLDSPIAVSGLPLAVFAAPYKGTAPNAAVALAMEVRVDDFAFTPLNDRFDGQLEITFVAVDSRGEVHDGDRHTITLAFREATLALAKQNGFRVVSQIDLPPGSYQLRVAAAERGGQVGSVLYDLEVPDFYRAPLSMSGISLTSVVQSQVPTGSPRNPLADFLPGPPTAAREFNRNDELALFVEFYENLSGTQPHAFDITATMLAEGGRAIMTSEEERSSTELQGSQGGYGFTARFPLQDLEPGLYVVRVEGRPRTASRDDAAGVSREVQIRIRPS